MQSENVDLSAQAMPPSNFDAIGCTFRGDGSSRDVLDATMGETGHYLCRFLSWASIEVGFAVTCKPWVCPQSSC